MIGVQPVRAARAGPRLLSVVVPVCNESDLVGELIQRLATACVRSGATNFELVVVNDGSRDDTLAQLITLSATVTQLRALDLRRNFGHMPALSAGLEASRGDAVVVLDGDLQDPPELIPELVDRWREGADVVVALRTGRDEGFGHRLVLGVFYGLLSRAADHPIPRSAGTYGLMDRRAVDIINALPERSRFFAGLRAWVGGPQAQVGYRRSARPRGRSRVGLLGQLGLAVRAFTSFSKTPLRIATLFSLCVGLGLFALGVAAFAIRLFTNRATPGWATFTTLIGVMGMAQSLVLAVLAEYVGVIFEEVKGRPSFVVRNEFVGGEVVAGGKPASE